MAIVRMKKITIVGLEKQKEHILETLMRLGVVEIVNVDPKSPDSGIENLVSKDSGEEDASFIEEDISKIKSAIESLSKYDMSKKPLFKPKRDISKREYYEILEKQDALWETVKRICTYEEHLSSLKSEENKLLNLIASLMPWRGLDIPFEAASTKSAGIVIGVVPSNADAEELKFKLYEEAPESYLNFVHKDREQIYLFAAFHKNCEEIVMRILKNYGFSKVSLKNVDGTAESNIRNAESRIKQIRKERGEIEEKIARHKDSKENLEVLYDHLLIRRDRKKALNLLVKTKKTFMLKGWLPEYAAGNVGKALNGHFDCIVDIKEFEKGEEHPVLLKNSPLVKPFELVTELYSLPKSGGIDPNVFMAPFFVVFFGMMMSDAGYGLIMAIVSGIVLRKFKPEGMVFKLLKLLFFGGISTFVWGALFGGWFGDIVQAVSSGRYEIPPLWFNPLDDPMRLLLWSFIFGGIHIFTGMALKGYMMIRDGRPFDALFDVGFWYVFLIGLVVLGVGNTGGVGGKAAADAGKYMSLCGAALLVLTQGRSRKGIFAKFFSGLLSLYNVTGFLSDVLSYSRLLALGLATGVIASVINAMGTLFGLSFGGIIALVVIFTGGTVFNILINTLGAYIHASRLQYVEFFGKFYEGGGKSFQPFKINTKYTNIN